MTRQKQNNLNPQRSREVSQEAERDLQPVSRLQSILLVGWVATLVATPLIPSEAAVEHGTHLLVIMLLLLIALAWLGQAVCLRVSLKAHNSHAETAVRRLAQSMVDTVLTVAVSAGGSCITSADALVPRSSQTGMPIARR